MTEGKAGLSKGYRNPKVGVITHFSEIIKEQYFLKVLKYKAMYGIFFLNWSLIISEKCMATPNFLLGYQEHLLSFAFSVLVLNRAKISLY